MGFVASLRWCERESWVPGKKYIHYGHKKFDRELFTSVRNGLEINKPGRGGLWASPVDSGRSWYNWAAGNRLFAGRLQTSFEFALSENARVLELTPDNVWDLPEDSKAILPRDSLYSRDYWSMVTAMDFEVLAREYDAVEVSLTEYPEMYWTLYGWDCDCILVMNPDVIVEDFE